MPASVKTNSYFGGFELERIGIKELTNEFRETTNAYLFVVSLNSLVNSVILVWYQRSRLKSDSSMPRLLQTLCLVILTAMFSRDACGQSLKDFSFNEHVRPILSNHCWSCHGPDEAARATKLRLDRRDSAVGKLESGKFAIRPGRPEFSELIRRINAHDDDSLMPPKSTKKPLTAQQKDVLEGWIDLGAKFTEHWAFSTPKRPEVPVGQNDEWAQNDIDRFVLKRLEDERLAPSKAAEHATWLRRVTLDLTGLPPSVEELDAFLDQTTRGLAYEPVVDRLLKSPRHAERMAMHWLDAARYADTNGYNNDETRSMWPWRDWVIDAFARGMPYDQFLIEQLAGDLLPEATLSQKVATGFNRNHVLTTEGGIIEEEYHVEYVADRVHTTATVFLGLSMQCARCHDHKYDPLSQREYYEFSAFFNNVPDKVVPYSQGRMAEPLLKVPSAAQQAELASIELRRGEIEKLLKLRATKVDADVARWEQSLTAEQIAKSGPLGLVAHFPLDEADGDKVVDRVDAARSGTIKGKVARSPGKLGGALSFDGNTFVDAGQVGSFDNTDKFSFAAWIQMQSNEASTVLSKIDDANAFRGYDLIMEGGKLASHFVHHWPDRAFKVVTKEPLSLKEWHHIVVTYDGTRRASGVKVYVDGLAKPFEVTTDNELSGTLKTDKAFHIGKRQASVPFKGLIDDVQLYAAELSMTEVAQLASGQAVSRLKELLATASANRSDAQREQLRQHYLDHVDAESKTLKTELADLPKRREAIEKAIPVTMVMAEQTPRRQTFVLKRGQYDQRGEPVSTGLPSVLDVATGGSPVVPPSPAVNAPLSRLDLARWLTNPAHPLTARVAVNRWWELLFGTGLVETSEDFGIQGALPSHPELLDWLATELVRTNWDQRAILKQIVLSATYRQSSRVTPELLERDPRNRLLTRGPRYRLSAESVRDNALCISGLLKEKLGGPSVKPYQPEGLWEDVSVERRDKYVPDAGEGLYRRSMYTFWKRTCPPPGMATFDAPDRETCVIRRARTNTPLQALVLLNDPTYVEAARKLAERVLLAAKTEDERLTLAFKLVVARAPQAVERDALQSLLRTASRRFADDKAAAEKLIRIGVSTSDAALPVPELAAWTTVVSILLNLDEAISKT